MPWMGLVTLARAVEVVGGAIACSGRKTVGSRRGAC
jgi:hypothetical protein